MSFFEDEPSDEIVPDDYVDFEESRTSKFIGGVLPFNQILARTDTAAIALQRIVAFKDGFEISIISYIRGSALKDSRRAYEKASPRTPFMHQSSWDSLNLGLLYPDGTKLFVNRHRFPQPGEQPAAGLQPQGGGGNDEEYTQDLFAYPLPGSGELKLVFEWAQFGIEENFVVLNASAITESGLNAKPVWDDDKDKPLHYTEWMWDAENENESDDE